MTGHSTPASGGVTDDPIRIGTMLFTLVEPHRGHEVDYNRWYERDHFYAGCQIGAFNFSGARFVSTADLKALRFPTGESALVADPEAGSYLGVYYVLAGHHDEWNRWAVDQVNTLHAAGRMFEHRDHIHTGLYRFAWEARRDQDGVPAELTLDHRFPGMVSVFVEAAEGVGPEEIADWFQNRFFPDVLPGSPVASVLAYTPIPLLADAPGDVPRDEVADRRTLLMFFVDEAPEAAFGSVIVPQETALAEAGLGRIQWASPFIPTVPGTDRYTDQLWA
jgi:hypothetical protein